MSIKTYGKRDSLCNDSSCCYLHRGSGLSISENGSIKPFEIERLEKAIENNADDFIPEYLIKIKQILEDRNFIKTILSHTFLNGDDSKNVIEFAMRPHYPCYFLAKDGKETSCMIYPYKFDICEENECTDCYKTSEN